MKFIVDFVKGVWHLIAYIPRGIAAIPMELAERRRQREEQR